MKQSSRMSRKEHLLNYENFFTIVGLILYKLKNIKETGRK